MSKKKKMSKKKIMTKKKKVKQSRLVPKCLPPKRMNHLKTT
jgi:hypothetical protein